MIVKILTEQHGIHPGMVRISKRQAGIYQPGNCVDVCWKARLAEHLGNFSLELAKPFAAILLDNPLKLKAMSSACSIVETTLAERDPHEEIYVLLLQFMDHLVNQEDWLKHYILLELELLRHLGFGLDLRQCAAGGGTKNLIYVSPKTGRAVSEAGGEPYKERLLPLPSFLNQYHSDTGTNSLSDMIDGIKLTCFFLEKYVYGEMGRSLPAARTRLFEGVQNLYLPG